MDLFINIFFKEDYKFTHYESTRKTPPFGRVFLFNASYIYIVTTEVCDDRKVVRCDQGRLSPVQCRSFELQDSIKINVIQVWKRQ